MENPNQQRQIALMVGQLCQGLASRRFAATAELRIAAERASALVRAGADPAEVVAALEELDDLLRRRGDSRGIGADTHRGVADEEEQQGWDEPHDVPAGLPKRPPRETVFRCPAADQCTRLEVPARRRWWLLRGDPRCEIHRTGLRRVSLRGWETG